MEAKKNKLRVICHTERIYPARLLLGGFAVDIWDKVLKEAKFETNCWLLLYCCLLLWDNGNKASTRERPIYSVKIHVFGGFFIQFGTDNHLCITTGHAPLMSIGVIDAEVTISDKVLVEMAKYKAPVTTRECPNQCVFQKVNQYCLIFSRQNNPYNFFSEFL